MLEREGETPERVLPGHGDGERDQPVANGEAEQEDEPAGDRSCNFEVAVDANVEQDQDQAHGDVREDERVLAAVQRIRHRARQTGDGEHAEQRQQPVDEVVGVEASRVERETRPGPADRQEQHEVAPEAGCSRIGAEGRRDLGDRRDEDEVEKELEPGRAAVLVGVERAESRRLEEALEACQRR